MQFKAPLKNNLCTQEVYWIELAGSTARGPRLYIARAAAASRLHTKNVHAPWNWAWVDGIYGAQINHKPIQPLLNSQSVALTLGAVFTLRPVHDFAAGDGAWPRRAQVAS